MLIPNLGRIAETAHTRAQDGAMSGSRSTFLGVQVEVQKEVILGAYKIDAGEAKKAFKGPVLGVENGACFGSRKWSLFEKPKMEPVFGAKLEPSWSSFKRPNISHVRCQKSYFRSRK